MNTKMQSHDFVLVETVWFILLVAGITATIVEGPSNAVADIGNQVELNCTADSTIDNWLLSKDGTATGELIIVGPGCSTVNPPFDDHCALESLGGGTTCNLIVFNITMEQAGVYKCLQGTFVSASILTVIDSPPVITVNSSAVVVAEESVKIACSLSYNGSMAPASTLRPHFYWQATSSQIWNNVYNSMTDNMIFSQLSVRADYKDITPFICYVYLKLIPPTTAHYANNTPDVDSKASSPYIEVLYSVYKISWSTTSKIISIGGTTCEVGVVNCTAYGNPPPSHEWFDSKENVSITNNATLDLAEINRSYKCVAYNTIKNEVHRYSQSYTPKSYSIIQDCRFPRSKSTWISVTPVEGCDNKTCACSSGHYGVTLLCNTNSCPSAMFQWTGADNSVIDSQVYGNVHINGTYSCTAYFHRASSNYTGNVIFSNGSNEINATECYEDLNSMYPVELTDSSSTDAAIAVGLLFCISFAVNVTILVIWVYNYLRAKQDQFKRTENVLQPEMMDLSNRTSGQSAYEELRRPDETQLQQSTYETLAPNSTVYVEPNIQKTGLDIIHSMTQN